jgi:hypothetical protein
VLCCEAAAHVPAGKAEAAQAPQAQDQTIAYIDLQPKCNQKLKDDFHSGKYLGNTERQARWLLRIHVLGLGLRSF